MRLQLTKLADPNVFPTLKHGYARGYETRDFVDNIRNYMDILDRLAPRDSPLVPRVMPEVAQASSRSVSEAR